MNTIFHILTNAIKVVKNLILQKSLISHETNWTLFFCLFHSQDLKPKRNHQIDSSRAKTRSRRSQICLKFGGNIICIKRNTDVNKSDLEKLQFFFPNEVDFPKFPKISPKINVFTQYS